MSDWMIVLFFALPVAAIIYDRWPRSDAAEYRHQYLKRQNEWHKRGLTPSQIVDEIQFSYAMARLRKDASDAAVADPAGYAQTLAKIVVREAETLALHDKRVSRNFVRVVQDMPLSDILYPDAFNLVSSGKTVDQKKLVYNDIDVAALTRLR